MLSCGLRNVVAVLGVLLLGCNQSPKKTAQSDVTKTDVTEQDSPTPDKTMSDLSTCTSLSACAAHDGKRVQIIGTYTVESPLAGKKGGGGSTLSLIDLGDGTVLLEPYWHQDVVRSDEEIARCRGKKVRVTGVYHAKPVPQPGAPDAVSYGGACVHPVEKVELD